MRVLFISPSIPWPVNSGAAQRSYAFVKAIARVHDVILATQPDSNEESRLAGLRDLIVDHVRLPVASKDAGSVSSSTNPLKNALSHVTDCLCSSTPYQFRKPVLLKNNGGAPSLPDFDVAFCRHATSVSYLPRSLWSVAVVDADDLMYRLLFQQALSRPVSGYKSLIALEALRTYRFERKILRSVAHTILCSSRDATRIRSARKSVLQNGVTLPQEAHNSTVPQRDTAVFVGTFRYQPNVDGLRWFVTQVLPEIRRRVPSFTLNVVGKDACGENLPFANVPGVTLVGTVDSTTPWFSSAVTSIVPIQRGAGTRIKILESLACGRPVISTVMGADGLDDLQAHHGVFRVKSPHEMARCIAELIQFPNSSWQAAAIGRELIRRHYAWDTLTASLPHDLVRWTQSQLSMNRD